MELNLHIVRSRLLEGDANRAWLSLAPLLTTFPEQERPALAEQIAEAVKLNVADADPVAAEQFFGRMFLACGLEEKGKQALARAVRWKEARARAAREFGLDFDDQAALYRFLGANDFREYARDRSESRSDGARLLLDEHTAALDPRTAAKVLDLSDLIVQEHGLTTLMITHNMKDAIAHGNRLIMMDAGQVVVDVSGEEKKKLTVPDLLAMFSRASGSDEANDKMLLS